MVLWIAGAALILFLSGLSWLFSELALHIRPWTLADLLDRERGYGRFDEGWYAALRREPVSIPSPNGYILAGEYWPVAHSRGIVILSHGATMNRNASLKYAEVFQEMGFSCLAYEHCRHGESGGKYTTYGYYERYDLKAVVDWVRERFGGDTPLGIHGESMGAAIMLQYAGLVEDGADFYISDCSFASTWEQLAYRLRKDYRLPVFPFLHLAAMVCRIRSGMRLKQASPLMGMHNIGKPVLFIHGEDDTYVPALSSQRLYEAKVNGVRRIAIIPGAGHATALPTEPAQYRRAVADFLEGAVPGLRHQKEETK